MNLGDQDNLQDWKNLSKPPEALQVRSIDWLGDCMLIFSFTDHLHTISKLLLFFACVFRLLEQVNLPLDEAHC